MDTTGSPVRSAPRSRLWASSLPLAATHTLHQLRYGRCVGLCFSTSSLEGFIGQRSVIGTRPSHGMHSKPAFPSELSGFCKFGDDESPPGSITGVAPGSTKFPSSSMMSMNPKSFASASSAQSSGISTLFRPGLMGGYSRSDSSSICISSVLPCSSPSHLGGPSPGTSRGLIGLSVVIVAIVPASQNPLHPDFAGLVATSRVAAARSRSDLEGPPGGLAGS